MKKKLRQVESSQVPGITPNKSEVHFFVPLSFIQIFSYESLAKIRFDCMSTKVNPSNE